MTNTEIQNISTVRAYLAALQNGEAGDSLRRFFTEDARQIEMPNRLNTHGQDSNLEHMLERSVQGLKILRHQRYEIVSEVVQGDSVAVEVRWTGILAISFGNMAPGAEMGASIALFFRFCDGRISSQHNYDCFDPW
jgi:ketosteroid isomerase-like protein